MAGKPIVAVVTAPCGDVDVANSPHLENVLAASLNGKPYGVILDLSATDYLDSSSLGVVIGFHRRLVDTSTKFILVLMPQSNIARLLERTGCDRLLAIESSVERAYTTLCPN